MSRKVTTSPKRRDKGISLSHLSFAEAVAALVRDDAPTPRRGGSPVAGSGNTKSDAPAPAPLKRQTARRR